METIGSRVTSRRKRLGLKGKELAERVGCHPPDISDWENSKNIPSVESLIKLARALETTETWLVSGKNPWVAGNGDENPKIRKMLIDNEIGNADNNPVAQMQDEMINDKRDIIELQKEKIRDLEARLAKLEGEKRSKPSNKKAG